ncbi:MAG: 50S ribosomal protein L9 [Candidatus Pacebacteria bacterium]|jgi:large subunit ribosomal protein L9|nr:50S ribosomal protein L9 [Candidatus Paceibacterota bacterium]
MKVIFIQNVAKQGRVGEIKEVSDGFAVNVLIPKKQAVIATPGAIRQLEEDKKNRKVKEVLDKNLLLKAMENLEEVLNKESDGFLKLTNHKKDAKGNLFSQVRENDIVDAVFDKIKVSLNPDQIVLGKEPLKKIGEYEVLIKDKEVVKKIKVLIA